MSFSSRTGVAMSLTDWMVKALPMGEQKCIP